ncbi:putative UBA-like superfamily, ubiquilin, Ubiquitin-associated domain-containing protein [Helianthus annuus]|nr:putative UBA-like superfamily, ubiquilin, Ubiquitin-associated domain-containing protein [Helianthus annuus]
MHTGSNSSIYNVIIQACFFAMRIGYHNFAHDTTHEACYSFIWLYIRLRPLFISLTSIHVMVFTVKHSLETSHTNLKCLQSFGLAVTERIMKSCGGNPGNFGGANYNTGERSSNGESDAFIQVPPEQLYATQLSQLQEMGFFDTQENIRALRATAGNVHAAVERLLGNFGP